MNSKQRRQRKRQVLRTAEFFADLLIELAEQAQTEDWDRDRLVGELKEQGTLLKTTLVEVQEGRN